MTSVLQPTKTTEDDATVAAVAVAEEGADIGSAKGVEPEGTTAAPGASGDDDSGEGGANDEAAEEAPGGGVADEEADVAAPTATRPKDEATDDDDDEKTRIRAAAAAVAAGVTFLFLGPAAAVVAGAATAAASGTPTVAGHAAREAGSAALSLPRKIDDKWDGGPHRFFGRVAEFWRDVWRKVRKYDEERFDGKTIEGAKTAWSKAGETVKAGATKVAEYEREKKVLGRGFAGLARGGALLRKKAKWLAEDLADEIKRGWTGEEEEKKEKKDGRDGERFVVQYREDDKEKDAAADGKEATTEEVDATSTASEAGSSEPPSASDVINVDDDEEDIVQITEKDIASDDEDAAALVDEEPSEPSDEREALPVQDAKRDDDEWTHGKETPEDMEGSNSSSDDWIDAADLAAADCEGMGTDDPAMPKSKM